MCLQAPFQAVTLGDICLGTVNWAQFIKNARLTSCIHVVHSGWHSNIELKLCAVAHLFADIQAAEYWMQFQYGWMADPLYFGDYPAIMRKSQGAALPTFTAEESQMLKGTMDYFAVNFYCAYFIRAPPADNKDPTMVRCCVRHVRSCLERCPHRAEHTVLLGLLAVVHVLHASARRQAQPMLSKLLRQLSLPSCRFPNSHNLTASLYIHQSFNAFDHPPGVQHDIRWSQWRAPWCPQQCLLAVQDTHCLQEDTGVDPQALQRA